jgi:hypothetical protein
MSEWFTSGSVGGRQVTAASTRQLDYAEIPLGLVVVKLHLKISPKTGDGLHYF